MIKVKAQTIIGDHLTRTIGLASVTGAVHLFTANADVDYQFQPLADGQQLDLGSSSITTIHTPGHTHESISYLINNKYLLTGDTLFADGVGRPDLKADAELTRAKAGQLFASLQKIKALESDPFILPAHTSQAVAFDEKPIGDHLSLLLSQIPFLQMAEQQFVQSIIERIPLPPANYLQIAAINKKGEHTDVDAARLEAGANRCAVS